MKGCGVGQARAQLHGSPARFSCTAFISTWALAKASSMARFLSSSRDCISSSICPCARSSSDSYMVICSQGQKLSAVRHAEKEAHPSHLAHVNTHTQVG